MWASSTRRAGRLRWPSPWTAYRSSTTRRTTPATNSSGRFRRSCRTPLADHDAGAVADVPVTFLYDDAALVVVNKPAGVAVIPMPGAPAGACLRDKVAAALGSRVWVVHRLDLDTSGVVVFARTAEAHRALSMAFERRDVVKHYAALVHG
ncbi:MAG: hypothetical protein JNL48_08900, partial [Acidobacteria bacterium]|nr:hypothetical protein [Acidobacteriota bacterium]